jgi:inner membrane organizing system protein 1
VPIRLQDSLTMSDKGAKSENEIPSALDKCIADSLIKLGSGVVTGGVLSLVLFKRKLWPVTLGAGIGLGMAMSNCQNKLNATSVVRRNLGGK